MHIETEDAYPREGVASTAIAAGQVEGVIKKICVASICKRDAGHNFWVAKVVALGVKHLQLKV